MAGLTVHYYLLMFDKLSFRSDTESCVDISMTMELLLCTLDMLACCVAKAVTVKGGTAGTAKVCGMSTNLEPCV